jgi:hypothetical protein
MNISDRPHSEIRDAVILYPQSSRAKQWFQVTSASAPPNK